MFGLKPRKTGPIIFSQTAFRYPRGGLGGRRPPRTGGGGPRTKIKKNAGQSPATTCAAEIGVIQGGGFGVRDGWHAGGSSFEDESPGRDLDRPSPVPVSFCTGRLKGPGVLSKDPGVL